MAYTTAFKENTAVRHLSFLGLIVTLLVGASTAAAAQTAANVCGTMTEYRAPSATLPGSITVGPEQFAIDSRATIDMSGDARLGSAVCLTGTWQMSQTIGRVLTELRVRPQVAPVVPTAVPTTAVTVPSTLPATRTDVPAQLDDSSSLLAGMGAAAVLLIGVAALLRRGART